MPRSRKAASKDFADTLRKLVLCKTIKFILYIVVFIITFIVFRYGNQTDILLFFAVLNKCLL